MHNGKFKLILSVSLIVFIIVIKLLLTIDKYVFFGLALKILINNIRKEETKKALIKCQCQILLTFV